MDGDGFRLSADTAKRLQAITTWDTMPEFKAIAVIRSFTLGAAKFNARGVSVAVTYDVLGHFEKSEGFTAEPQTHIVEIEAREQAGDWKIVDEDNLVRPHILAAYLVKWLREQAAAEKNPATKRVLEGAARQLESQ